MQSRQALPTPARIAAGASLIAASSVILLGVVQQWATLVAIGAVIALAAAVALAIGAGPGRPGAGNELIDELHR